MKKIDLHVHTSEVSSCARVPAAEMVRIYKEAGYDGVVITDHYHDGYFSSLQGGWDSKVERYLTGYHLARQEGERLGLRVYLGMELRNNRNDNDYLVFGLTEKILLENPALYALAPRQFKKQAERLGLVVYQAHPFRDYMERLDEADILLDGVEVYNGNPRANSRNRMAEDYAEKFGLCRSSGSDFHRPEDIGTGGILLERMPENEKELVKLLPKAQLVIDGAPQMGMLANCYQR